MPYLRDDHNNKITTHEGKEQLFTRNTIKLYTENTPEEDDDLEFDEENINFVNEEINDNSNSLDTYQV